MVKQEDRRAATRFTILEAALDMFETDGYAATSVDDVAKRAGVAKGAIYHHFPNKAALFEAVVETVSTRTVAVVVQAISGAPDFWSATEIGNRAFLLACAEPKTARVLLHDGPAVLGWQKWREIDHRNFGGLVRHSLATAVDAGILSARDPDKMTKLAIGVVTQAAFDVAESESPAECVEQYLSMISAMMRGWARG